MSIDTVVVGGGQAGLARRARPEVARNRVGCRGGRSRAAGLLTSKLAGRPDEFENATHRLGLLRQPNVKLFGGAEVDG